MAPAPGKTAFLFDLDDTLFDHRFACQKGLTRLKASFASLRRTPVHELLSEYGTHLETLHPLTLSGRLPPQRARSERIRLLFASHGEDLSRREAARRAALYRTAYLCAERGVPGAAVVLRTLWRQGHRIGIVTNNAMRGQRRKLETAGVSPYVRTLVISQAIGISKPDPRIFREALRRLGARAGETVMVGDSFSSDVLGALNAGLAAIWFNPRRSPASSGPSVPQIASWHPASAAIAVLRREVGHRS